MSETSSPFEVAVRQVGAYAATLIRPGMRLGLGTGRTASAFLGELSKRLDEDLNLVAVCTSRNTEERARAMGIEIVESTEEPLDLDLDGADEIDPDLNLIKGGGGAMVREKVVAERSRRFWVLADENKLVPKLGERHPVPLEILPFDWRGTAQRVRTTCDCRLTLRGGDRPFVTDNGNLIFDLEFTPGGLNATQLALELSQIPGVLGHGLFLGTATAALISDGATVRVIGDLDRLRDPV
ncbi:MAG: ribose-5-phosphate isomerase RpiA [Candidatus Dormibacteria bacterium]